MRKYIILACLLICTMLTSCGKDYMADTFFCMDTLATVKADTEDGETLKKCRELLMELDVELSRHNEKGKTAEYNSSQNGAELSRELKELVVFSCEISKDTDGAFNVFSGSLTKLWNESENYPDEEKIKKALSSVISECSFDGSFLEKPNEDTMLEFGGIAKGYACDKAVALLKENSVRSGMVSFSSSIGVFGSNPDGEPWKIAIKDPIDTEAHLGYVRLEDGFLSVSGDYERFYEIDGKKYNHIIDIKSGLPVDNGVHSVTVVAPTGAQSDALSTAFFVMGAERVKELYWDSDEIKYLIVNDEGVFMNPSMEKIFVEK